ncbi:MAG: ATP-binding cassette domain-containing protein, partial [Schaedlerella arabinosiphila]|nr:ATP-binding cassette domain-containing protein [Schaedlerella arabinosiphila]
VSKTFGKQEVLRHVSLSMKSGNIYGLIGRNGSGKTVLMKCICGLLRPTSGQILMDGRYLEEEERLLEDFGIIIGNPGFLPNYSGRKNLRMLAMIRGKCGKEKIDLAMRQVGLDPEMSRKVSEYSMGMKQRLGIAQAIMEENSILILDEPMNGLDNQGVEDMRKLFQKLKEEGRLILLASHSSEDIEVLCDQVFEMDAGILGERV